MVKLKHEMGIVCVRMGVCVSVWVCGCTYGCVYEWVCVRIGVCVGVCVSECVLNKVNVALKLVGIQKYFCHVRLSNPRLEKICRQ